MTNPKLTTTKEGKPLHQVIGALIEKEGKYLLIDRRLPPLGFAGLAGHIDEGEEVLAALHREVKEESGLSITSQKLLFEEERNDECVMKVKTHYWYFFKCETTGEIELDEEEEKSIQWYAPEEIKKLTLDPSWEYWLKKVKVIGP